MLCSSIQHSWHKSCPRRKCSTRHASREGMGPPDIVGLQSPSSPTNGYPGLGLDGSWSSNNLWRATNSSHPCSKACFPLMLGQQLSQICLNCAYANEGLRSPWNTFPKPLHQRLLSTPWPHLRSLENYWGTPSHKSTFEAHFPLKRFQALKFTPHRVTIPIPAVSEILQCPEFFGGDKCSLNVI